MYARVISGVVLPGKMDELVELVNEKLAPAGKEQQGMRSFMLLTDAGSGRALSISLWDSKEAMLEGENNQFLERQLEQVLPLLDEAPSTRNFRVASGP